MPHQLSAKYPKTSAFLANLRFPQLLYHAGLLLIGSGLAWIHADPEWRPNFAALFRIALAIAAVWSAWIASVVVNDIVDLNIDRISNPDRPLPRKVFSPEEYLALGTIFFLFSLVLSGLADWRLILLLGAYQLVAFAYSAWPLRLKRFPLIGTFASALASVLVIFSGFILLSPEHDLAGFPWSIGALLLIGYTLALPIKDFKDYAGDKNDKVHTLPVVLGIPWAKVLVGSGIFFSFMLSVAILNDFRLFWWAFACGLLVFTFIWKMQQPVPGCWLHFRNIFWWLLGTTLIYLCVIVYSFFTK